MSKSTLASLALAGTALVFALGSANAATFPAVGANPAGPSLIITLNPGGTGTIAAGPSSGPYDGTEDTYIGLINSSGQSVSSIVLSAASSVGIFGFDIDGIGAPIAGVYTQTGTVQYGTPNANDVTGPCLGGSCVGGGYGGPRGFFSGLGTAAGIDSGTFNIVGGLADGDFTWFSLEEPLSAVSFTAQVGSTDTTPVPGALPLFASGLGALGLFGWRKKRKAAAAA